MPRQVSYNQSYEACPGMPIITTKSAALYMATACVRYLLLDDFSSGLSSLETSPVNSKFSESEGATKIDDMWGDQDLELDIFAEPDELEATIRRRSLTTRFLQLCCFTLAAALLYLRVHRTARA